MRKRLLFGSGVLLLAILVTLVVWQGSFNFGSFAPLDIQQTYLFWAVSTLIFVPGPPHEVSVLASFE